MRKLILAGATLVAALAIPVAVHAGFSPSDRATFQCASPTDCAGANYVTFNSITNAPNYGDERAFVDAKDAADTASGGFQDSVNVHDGEKVTMRVYIHNDANPNAIGVDAATAHNTRLQVLLPTSQDTTNTAAAQISADNANPGTVSDTVDFTGSNPFNLSFDQSSPVQVTYRPNGTGDFVTRTLPGAAFSNAQTLNAALGDWNGCFNYSALITVTVVVHMQTPQPTFACSGLDVAEVDRTRFNFTAHATVQNASVTSYTFTAKNSSGTVVDTNTVSTSALSASYAFNQSNPDTYTVSAVVNTDKGSTDPATCTKQVTVKPQTVTPVFACTGLSSTQIDRTHYDLTATASVQNASVTSYTFTTKDSNGKVVDSQTVSTSALSAVYHFNQSTAGTYTVSAVVNTDHGSTNAGDCTKQVTVQPEQQKPVFACNALNVTVGTGRSITAAVDYTAQNGASLDSVNYDFGDGNTLMTDKTSVNHTYTADGTYTVSATLTFSLDSSSKDSTSNTVRCSHSVTITTPTTPPTTPPATTLPNTGPGDVVGLFAGASAFGAAGHYVVNVRRNRR